METLVITWQEVGAFAKDFLLPIFGAIGGVVGGLLFLYKRWFKNWYAHYKASRDQWRILMMYEMKEIKTQLFPNGGSSLCDRVTSIAHHQAEHDTILADLQTGQRVTREVMDIICWESDATGNVTFVGGNLCDLLNCNPHQILGNSWIGLIDPTDRRRVIEAWKESVANASFFKEEFYFITGDGEKIKVRATARHNKSKDQKLKNSLVRFTTVN